jgi:hypothetical protein
MISNEKFERCHQASSTIPSSAGAFSLADVVEEIERLALRGGLMVTVFSGEPSFRFSDLRADRVRFLDWASAGLDDGIVGSVEAV